MLPASILIKDGIGKRIRYKGSAHAHQSKTVLLFAFENTVDKRSYITFLPLSSNNSFNLLFSRQTMFAEPVRSIVEVDKANGMIAILFDKAGSGYAIARTDFLKQKLTVLQNCYQRSGIRVLKVVPLDYEQYVLIYGER